jgi:hypothetical protein
VILLSSATVTVVTDSARKKSYAITHPKPENLLEEDINGYVDPPVRNGPPK